MERVTKVTVQGLKKLEDELEYLKTEKRKEMSEQIKVARSFGDLSENSEYDEAKNAQAIVEARIAELQEILKNVELVDENSVATGQINMANRVRVLDVEFDEEEEYTIVGSSEVDLENNKISDESPIGKALLGHRVGDVIDVETPGGIMQLKVLEIQ